MSRDKWAQPQQVDGLVMAFGGRMADLLPPLAEIPKEFRAHGGTEWNRLTSMWFFRGLKGRFIAKDGIDHTAAIRHITTLLRSFEPKHEHKEAAVAYLMSRWFERFEPTQEATHV